MVTGENNYRRSERFLAEVVHHTVTYMDAFNTQGSPQQSTFPAVPSEGLDLRRCYCLPFSANIRQPVLRSARRVSNILSVRNLADAAPNAGFAAVLSPKSLNSNYHSLGTKSEDPCQVRGRRPAEEVQFLG